MQGLFLNSSDKKAQAQIKCSHSEKNTHGDTRKQDTDKTIQLQLNQLQHSTTLHNPTNSSVTNTVGSLPLANMGKQPRLLTKKQQLQIMSKEQLTDHRNKWKTQIGTYPPNG